MTQILASLDDINANLADAGTFETATDPNTALLQVSIARIIRGYMSRVFDNATIMSWDTPAHTPELIREAAGKMIAAQHYFNTTSAQTIDVDQNSFAQKRYDEAMSILNSIINGDIELPGITSTPTDNMTDLDYFPIDATDRAFTMGMNL